ncbi:unnamed protein product [Prunus armeniaca]|uniref:Uncharacterized protein n=1 Tax=Prunus armeniaca TaxID=36596 RepID=A0A6J5YCE0_PRUAR|nr:unnamed protein product [Prunus armeniaca]
MYITVLAIFIVVCQNSWPTVFLLIPLIWLNIWYRNAEHVLQENVKRVNANLRMDFHNNGSNEWFGFRMETLGSLVFCISTVFMFLLPSSIIKPENVGLTLSYGLPLNGVLFWYRLRGYQKQPHGYMSCFV